MKHNPDNLSDEVIEIASGYRLLEDFEIGQGLTAHKEIELWNSKEEIWNGHVYGNAPEITYRTKLSPQELLCLRRGLASLTGSHPVEQRQPKTYIFLPTWCLWLIASGVIVPILILLYLILK